MTDPFGGVYRGRRVLVTGHTGFKGSWLSLWLAALGAEVWGLALPPEGSRTLYGSLALEPSLRSRLGDIRDAAAVAAVFAAARPEVVFHLAAQPLVLRSYQAPVETFEVNALGTAQILDGARAIGCAKAIVAVTTDKVYEEPEAIRPRAESDALGGHDPYSASKACSEIVAACYRRSFHLPLATARAGNVIGGGDRAANRLLPDCVRAFADGRTAKVRHPASIRPWQHVLEPLSGYLSLGARLFVSGTDVAEAWNFGPAEDGVTVSAVAQCAAESWGAGATWQAEETETPHEASALRLDSSKATARLGWVSVWDARRAVAESIDWYRAAEASGFNARETSTRQIFQFTADAAAAGAAWAEGLRSPHAA